MQVLVVPDSLKGSCSAQKTALAISKGVKKVFPEATLLEIPFSDGGEGALNVLKNTIKGKTIQVTTTNACGEKVVAQYYKTDSKTAWVELAQASGLEGIPLRKRNPKTTSTFGTGLLIKHAIEQGCRHIRLSIGGSATNDAGMGIFCALGGKLIDRNNNPIPMGAEGLLELHKIILPPEMEKITWEIICDVDNPFIGPKGASKTYAPQKGANHETVELLEKCLTHFAQIVKKQFNTDISSLPGSGAAGGTAGGLYALFNAQLRPGFEVMSEILDLERHITASALVITAEGRLDGQSLHGKAPVGIARLCKKNGRPCIGIAGSFDPRSLNDLYNAGFSGIFPLQHAPISLEESMTKTESLFVIASENACRVMQKTILL